MTLKIGSLFSGYGGLDLAVQSVYDAEHAWFCEFDPAPSKILAHHWPDIPNLRDVTTVDWSTVEPIDILTGGFPCQDVSVAGRRAGMTDGTRSGLWSHMAHAIDILRPQLVVIENVGGLFSAEATSVMESHPLCLGDDGAGEHAVLLRAIDAVLSTLSELGYDAEWTALRASDAGAPHGRLRVFITAHPSCGGGGGRAALTLTGDEGGAHAEAQRAGGRPDLSEGTARLKILPTPRASAGMSSPLRPGAKDTSRLEDAVAVNLLPTPSIADTQGGRKTRSGDRSDELLLNGLAAAEAFGPYAPAIERWERVIGRPAPSATEPGKARSRLSARFVEWLMGLDAGHVTGVGLTRNQELKALGNGVVPQQGAAALAHLHSIRSTNP